MQKQSLIHFLTSTNLVSVNRAEEIAAYFKYKKIDKYHFFLQEGKVCNNYLFLEKGFMRSFAFDTEGNEVTTNFYSENQVVFEVSSFFNRTTSIENIQALTDCDGYIISYQELNMLFHALPEFREFGRHILVKGFTALKSRMLSTITQTAEERYAALLKNHPEIFKHAPLKHIASFLGITDTSLSRIRKDFSKK